MERTSQRLRLLAQAGFLALVLLIGWEFRAFVLAALDGRDLPRRPPGVEGFLPVSALMSLRLLLSTGEVHPYHPAGLFILLGAAAMSLAAGKSFCGWLCPFGLLSELLHKLRRRLSPGVSYPPAWLDRALSALKYLPLGFFVYAVFFGMDLPALRAFLDGDYNLVADAKMYFFFARLSPFAAWTLAALLALSFAVPFFWCRYLCPYGALLGLFSFAAPLKIRRDAAACTGCAGCARACPQGLAVDKCAAVRSDKCNSCGLCLEACPAPRALELRAARGPRLRPALLALAALVFFGSVWLGMLSGHWRNSVPDEVYRALLPRHAELGHPG